MKLQAAENDWKAKDHQKKFNRGITAPIETRLQKGDKIYRVAGSRQTKLEDEIGGSPLGCGSWWFDYETCLFLCSKCKDRCDEGFRNAARSAVAVLRDWSDMNYCVAGVLSDDFGRFTEIRLILGCLLSPLNGLKVPQKSKSA